ncbi:MAG TPA: hypothetical protein VJ725_32935 [Thermoanaerobaculia bacterium]|nr:hypothetical protein [Thermoanaerobaculia bacterium]
MRRLAPAAALLLALPALGLSTGRQLAADRVPPGSALEALVKTHQDFEKLRPEERREDERVPPWLKVLWRKAHPQGRYTGKDPAGGYPLILKEIHEWMVTHPDLVPGRPEPDLVPRQKAAETSANTRISGPAANPRSESDIRVNPWDPQKIVAASNNIVGSGLQMQYYSFDGGATWGRTTLPLAPGDAFHTDPTVDWTSDGTAWATTIGVSASGSTTRIRAYRSKDGGATWTLDGTVSGDQKGVDKQMVWVDHAAGSPYKDTLYAIWHNSGPVYLSRRRPGGAWEPPVLVSRKQPGVGIGADVKTNSAGTVFAFWPNTQTRAIQAVRSNNGGVSYTRPVTIATTIEAFDIGIPAQSRRRALIYVSGGAFRSGVRNLVYAAWTDLNVAGCKIGAAATPATACKTRIWFTRSTDGGRTWEPVRKINDQAQVNDQFNQALAVDEATGKVAVIYYDTAGDPARRKVHLWYQSSADDGATWSAPLRVTTAPTDESVRGAEVGNQFGDYNGLSGFRGLFFPSWTDRRSGGREEIWTAPIEDPD